MAISASSRVNHLQKMQRVAQQFQMAISAARDFYLESQPGASGLNYVNSAYGIQDADMTAAGFDGMSAQDYRDIVGALGLLNGFYTTVIATDSSGRTPEQILRQVGR